MEGRIEEHEKLGKGDGSKGENQEEETIRVIRGRKVAMPRQPASKGSHRLYVTCVKDA